MTDTSTIDRVETGVPGLDTILSGGLLKGGVYIVEGAPGSGKTILGNQICFYRASRGDTAVYLTLLAESHTRLLSHLRSLSFFKPELVASSIFYTSAFKVLEKDGLDGLFRAIEEAQRKRNASFLVLDGLVSAEQLAPSAQDFKKFIHEIQTISGMTGTTVLLLASTPHPGTYRSEHTMVDGIIELSETVIGVRSIRGLVIRKLRGAAQLRGRHTFEISNAGIFVRPRIEALLAPLANDETERDDPPAAEFGIPGLDEMLNGGLPGESTTVLLGATGSGKTLLGLHFLTAGARRGEVGLYVGFFERPPAIMAKARRLDLGLADLRSAGLVRMYWEAPVEGVLDAVVERVLREVTEHGIKRICFDGLHGFRHHAEYPERTRAVFSALANTLARLGVSSIFTLETNELFGQQIEVPLDGVSALADNLILLRQVELKSELRKVIAIIKARDTEYDARIREFKITKLGITLTDTLGSADHILTGSPHVLPDATRE